MEIAFRLSLHTFTYTSCLSGLPRLEVGLVKRKTEAIGFFISPLREASPTPGNLPPDSGALACITEEF
ncbi:hypothetical protein NDU88_001593 [Pleurodeles waltl]|uniref:Uncharacterized protein n=1 Tax=Pleurodeles waltl TaxID=8319 RepID=A0AAV7UUN5_PLEWA|nr:hypothetical protein NDU88_001593 [Pleurodeles waltl]